LTDGRRPAIPRRAAAVALEQLAKRYGLGALADALGVQSGGTHVHVSNSLTFAPRMSCCAGGHPLQHLRATPVYRGLTWYDGVAFWLSDDGSAVVRYGVAQAIIRAVAGRCGRRCWCLRCAAASQHQGARSWALAVLVRAGLWHRERTGPLCAPFPFRLYCA